MVNKLTLDKLNTVVNENKVVLIDFYADWCGPCRAMGPVVEELSNELGDVASFFKVNVDDNEEFARQFNVSSIPTFVVIKDGKLAKKIVGMTLKESLVEAIKN